MKIGSIKNPVKSHEEMIKTFGMKLSDAQQRLMNTLIKQKGIKKHS